MIHTPRLIALAAFATLASALPAKAITWAEADKRCSPNCAVANSAGSPAFRDGSLVCRGEMHLKPGTTLTVAERQRLAKDTSKLYTVKVPKALLKPEKK